FTFNACIDAASGPCRCNSRSFMKKSAVLAGSLVVAAAAYTGAAWYMGMEAENTIRAAVDRANQRIIKTLGPDVGSVGATLSIDAYQRGLFSSRARYTFTLQDGDDRTQVTFEDHMQHGPFPWGLVLQPDGPHRRRQARVGCRARRHARAGRHPRPSWWPREKRMAFCAARMGE